MLKSTFSVLWIFKVHAKKLVSTNPQWMKIRGYSVMSISESISGRHARYIDFKGQECVRWDTEKCQKRKYINSSVICHRLLPWGAILPTAYTDFHFIPSHFFLFFRQSFVSPSWESKLYCTFWFTSASWYISMGHKITRKDLICLFIDLLHFYTTLYPSIAGQFTI